MSVTGYTKAGADAKFAPVSTFWQASTAVKTGQLLTHSGITYVVNADMTTPSTFNTTGLTVVGGGGTGSTLTPTAVKTANYTAVANDFVPVDSTSSSPTITLPTGPTDGAQVGLKHVIRGGTNVATLACGGSDVFNKAGGSTTLALGRLNQAVIAQYKASTGIWYVVGGDAGGLGGAADLNVGTTTGTVAAGDDARIVAAGNLNIYLAANYR